MLKRALAATVALSSSLLISTAIGSSPSHAVDNAAAATSSGTLVSARSGRCADVPRSTIANSTQLQVWDCNGGANQQVTYDTSTKALQVLGKCFDAHENGTTDGTKVETYDCGSKANQKWTLASDGSIVGDQSGKCLDVTGASNPNGTGLQLWTCNGGTNQKWTFGGEPPATGGGDTPPSGNATVVRYPTPSYFATSSAYSLKIDGTSIDVRKTFDYSFAQFAYSGTATFAITAKEDINSYNVSPHSYGIKATKSGRTLTFSLAQAKSRYIVVTVNSLETFVIAADPLETGAPVPNGGSVKSFKDYSGVDSSGGQLMTSRLQTAINDANKRSGGGTVYVPAGIYKFSQLELKSNVTLYLAAGAVLRGSSNKDDYNWSQGGNIRIVGASNAAIKGRGLIDSNGSTLTTGDSGPNRENIIRSSKSGSTKPTGLTFDGITLRDGTTWNFDLTESNNVSIKNVKIFNNTKWIHGDAFDLVNVSHALVDQCLAFTGDDAFDAKASSTTAMSDVVYQNSVAYTRSAGTKLGMQGSGNMSDIWFENIDVVQGYRGVSVSHDQGAGKWSNLHFIDIRTEKIFNNGTGGQFRTSPILVWTAEYSGSSTGPVSDVELTRISFEDLRGFTSYIQGYDSNGKVSNIAFTDLTVAGKKITKASDALITIGSNTSNITFK